MTTRMKATGKSFSVPAGLGLSLAVNIGITLIITGLLSHSIQRKTIEWETVGYWIMIMLLLSSFFGAKTAMATIKTQYLLISFMSGVLYWFFLLCITALFFGGNYHSVFETAALITAGSIAAVLIRAPKKKISSGKKRGVYR